MTCCFCTTQCRLKYCGRWCLTCLTLDTFQHRAWVSITPFWINHLRPPGIPSLPWISHFAELNVRTYVTVDGKPGVYFFSLDASHLVSGVGRSRLLSLALLACSHEA